MPKMLKKMYLEAGRIVGTHGVRGELRVQPWCDSPAQFAILKTLYWDENGTQAVAAAARPHKNVVLCKLDGVDSVEAASALRGRMLYCHRDDLQLPPDRHFLCDLIGLRVVDAESGEEYGTVCDVTEVAGSNSVYHLRTPKGEVLMPAIPDIVKALDVDGGEVRITPMKGLFDDAD